MDRPTRYRELLALASKYGVYEDSARAKGSERLWIRVLPDGHKRSIPVTCHGSGYVIGVGLVKAIRRRLLLTPADGVTDEEFYANKLKLQELAVPYVVQEVDYRALQQFIEAAFVEEYGQGTILEVRVAHFNPDLIDATVLVKTRQPEMDITILQLSDEFRRSGLRVGISVAQSTA